MCLETYNLLSLNTVPDNSRMQVLLPAKELTVVGGHFGRAMPVLFITVSPSCASKLRSVFNMKEGLEPYFCPNARSKFTFYNYQTCDVSVQDGLLSIIQSF